MGGETLLTDRFENLVDFMIEHKRFDLSFSFVTNGTVYNQRLIDKLKKFMRVGIEVSMESTTVHNDYIRQGTDTNLVLFNLEKYKINCDNSSISVTMRPAISALSIGYYHTVLDYCLQNNILIKSLAVTSPGYLNVDVLPKEVKEQYMTSYQKILLELEDINIDNQFNESDSSNYKKSVKVQAIQCLNLLKQTEPTNQEELLKSMVEHCRRWDSVYNLNARELYPELAGIFNQHDY
jgi:sulfatase maturation enzyme AslB (radical SAM superfamily)